MAVLVPLNTKNDATDATTYPQRREKMLIRQLPGRWFGGREYKFWTRSPDLTSAPPLPLLNFLCRTLLNFRFTFRQRP